MSELVDSRAAKLARAVIDHHSKSFALASKLLPADARLDAQVLYAWCRHVDDAVDEVGAERQPAALSALRRELDAVYAGEALADPLLSAFQTVVQDRGIPRTYAEELIAGMEMDVLGQHYARWEQLLRYGYRVAGTVGLMMCHVMGVRTGTALTHAAHLGIGMQLTNIARDVLEDWGRGRLYLPDDLLARHGAGELRSHLGGAFPRQLAPAVASAVAEMLDRADGYYASGDAGLPHLSARCAFGVRTARLVYSNIGEVLRARGCDVLSGRAIVPKWKKILLALRAGAETLMRLPASLVLPRPRVPAERVDDPRAVLMLPGS
jgi:phytoene synthase